MNLLSRIVRIYLSTQFVKYIICGSVSSLVHIVARLILSRYMDFGWAVFTSYFIGMAVALILYRIFVFRGQDSSVARQFLLFSISYIAFLPVTWFLSIVSEPRLANLFPTATAQTLAHLIGVAGPVILNFAYNKFITFGERLEPDETKSAGQESS
jgi:putative flippase GtrA